MNLLEIEKDSKDYERFLSKITITQSGCWEVSGWKNKDGYAFISLSTKERPKKNERAHRYSYELFKGKIPKGLVLDHLCRNPCCANPDHLEAVTNAENLKRGNRLQERQRWYESLNPEEKLKRAKHRAACSAKKAASATHCKRGHEWTLENTYRDPKYKKRSCRACQKISIDKRKNNKNREVGYRLDRI